MLSIAPKPGAKIAIEINSRYNLSIEYLELASDKSYYSWVEANNILAYIYIYIERDFEKALIKTDRLIQTFPEHPYYPFLKAEALLRLNLWEEYDLLRPKLMKLATNHSSEIVREECKHKLDYLDAYRMFYNIEQYEQTIIKTTNIIDYYSMEFDWLLGLCYFLRGQAYMEINEIEKAKDDFLEVSKMTFKFPEIEEAQTLLDSLNAHK